LPRLTAAKLTGASTGEFSFSQYKKNHEYQASLGYLLLLSALLILWRWHLGRIDLSRNCRARHKASSFQEATKRISAAIATEFRSSTRRKKMSTRTTPSVMSAAGRTGGRCS